MRAFRSILLCLAIVATPAAAISQLRKIEEASWLAGRWVGEGFGGHIEETWSPPAGGQMVGHFELVRGGKVVFYELLLLDTQPSGLRMRVKHFNADFTGWEDKAGWHTFEPVRAGPGALEFEGLSLKRDGEELAIFVRIKDKDGKVAQQPIRLRRSPL